LVSTKVCTVSSRKKALPSVRSINMRLRVSRLSSWPRRAVSNSSALSGGNGSILSWV
jgi:hypothetical protein